MQKRNLSYLNLSFIEQHYSEDISIEDISSFCGLNRSYFSKVFRDTMGESPQGFLLHYRMARAAQLLTESRLPISTISTMVSYPNQLHFSRAFKNVYGISPRDYRAKHLAL
jgi:AraC-like DNA-binding protein